MLLRKCYIVLFWLLSLRIACCKWIEGRIDTKQNWAFLARFCFLSLEGQFEYQIEYDKEMGTPNLLLYYDDNYQWPSVYHSKKTCEEREAILNKGGVNQIIKLSHWYPDTEYSGCVVTRANKELPASKSATTKRPTTTKPQNKIKNDSGTTPSFYDRFLKTSTAKPITSIFDTSNSTTEFSTLSSVTSDNTTWYELPITDGFNVTEDLWESVGHDDQKHSERIKNDVEMLFDNNEISTRKIKRSTSALYERYHRRRLNAESSAYKYPETRKQVDKLIVTCHNSRRFRSARERWWFIAVSNCNSQTDSRRYLKSCQDHVLENADFHETTGHTNLAREPEGLDLKYRFLMTNGNDGDFWYQHFSADEFYVLPVLLAYTFAYVIVMVVVVMCSVELKTRHLLHSTYKLFLLSIVSQHCGVTIQALGYIKYAVNGYGGESARVTGQFLCGLSEMLFLLLLVLMAKGYTITRGRLKVGFTVKLTVFMCCYFVTYIVLFVYQAKAFDPGEVLYLYESPAGNGLIVLRILGWCMFAYATFFTVKKFPNKNTFYCPFSICGTLWFYAGPLFILTANSYIDKWVRESVVTAVLLFIAFSGHIMFLLLTLPVFANKNFPYHVRTTQIGIMEVTGNTAIDNFGNSAYHPTAGASQTVIIPLTRRTEELIGNIYSQYMATGPPLALNGNVPKLNGTAKRLDSLSPTSTDSSRLPEQDSIETNTPEDIKPDLKQKTNETKVNSPNSGINSKNGYLKVKDRLEEAKNNETKDIFTVDNKMNEINTAPDDQKDHGDSNLEMTKPKESNEDSLLVPLPVLRSHKTKLEPLKRDDVPSWSLAKGPSVIAMHKKSNTDSEEIINDISPQPATTNKKVPAVNNGLPSSGVISTIHEDHVLHYNTHLKDATLNLFSAGKKNTY